jgi:hypothetical protein
MSIEGENVVIPPPPKGDASGGGKGLPLTEPQRTPEWRNSPPSSSSSSKGRFTSSRRHSKILRVGN